MKKNLLPVSLFVLLGIVMFSLGYFHSRNQLSRQNVVLTTNTPIPDSTLEKEVAEENR